MVLLENLKLGKLYRFSTNKPYKSVILVLDAGEEAKIVGEIYQGELFIPLAFIDQKPIKIITLQVLTSNGIVGEISLWPEEIHELEK